MKPKPMSDLKALIARQPATIARDFAGAAALITIFLTALHLPLI